MFDCWKTFILSFVAIAFLASSSTAAIDIEVSDRPNDNGRALIVKWNIPDLATSISEYGYRYSLQRAESASGPFEDITPITDDAGSKMDGDLNRRERYYYRIKIASETKDRLGDRRIILRR